VFFKQARTGRRGREFMMLTFRSMRADAPELHARLAAESNEADGPIFKMKDDPRVTPVGRFMRKFSLDEVPQLLNVLRGEMSLVGPRPLPTYETKDLTPEQNRRHEMPPVGRVRR
jgi:lipopolysaccharide/colanic/teichoic acid biosynthesis glycosyltransferase